MEQPKLIIPSPNELIYANKTHPLRTQSTQQSINFLLKAHPRIDRQHRLQIIRPSWLEAYKPCKEGIVKAPLKQLAAVPL